MRNSIRPLRILLAVLLAMAGLSILSNRTIAAEEADEQTSAQRMDRLQQQMHKPADRPMLGCPQGPMRGGCQMGAQCMKSCDDRMQACHSRRWHYPGCCILATILIVLAVVHVLLAVWVYQDIRKRGEGSGIFIVLALLIGIPGTALYLLARIGDRKMT
jgi:hypothetical protein